METDKKDKCVVKFITKEEVSLIEYLKSQVSELIDDETEDKNLCYVGANPYNYS